MTTLLALLVAWEFRNVVVYVLISLMLSAALRPLINRLVGRGFVVGVTWIGLYWMVLGGFGFLLFLTVRTAMIEIQQLAQNMSALNAWTLPIWLQGTSFQQTVVARLPTPNMVFEAFTGNQGRLVMPALLGFAQGIGDVVTGVIIILFLSVYWSLSQIHFERLWLSLLPSGLRKQARGIWRTIEPNIGAYIRSEVIQSLLAGLLLGLGYWLLGSPLPGAARAGRRSGMPDTRYWGDPGGHPGAFGGTADQCAAWLIHDSLCDHHLERPGSVDQAAPFQSPVG
jgi:predicted PurR-regulated permease PerM